MPRYAITVRQMAVKKSGTIAMKKMAPLIILPGPQLLQTVFLKQVQVLLKEIKKIHRFSLLKLLMKKLRKWLKQHLMILSLALNATGTQHRRKSLAGMALRRSRSMNARSFIKFIIESSEIL